MPLATFRTVRTVAQDGSVQLGVEIHPAKKFLRGYWLTPDQDPVVLAANGQATLRFVVDSQGHFDWAYIMGTSTGAYSLEFFDGGRNKLLQNRPVHSDLIVGNAFRPLMMPKPYFIDVGDSQREIQCVVRDLSGAQNTVRLVLYGSRIYHKEMPPQLALDLSREFVGRGPEYSYFLVPKETLPNGDLDAVAAGGLAELTFEADDSANIELKEWVAGSNWGNFFADVMVRERDTLRGIVSAVSPVNLAFGSVGIAPPFFPIFLPDSYLLERKKQLIVTARNTSGSPQKPFLMAAGKRWQQGA